MVPVRTYRTFWEHMKTLVPQVNTVYLFATEKELTKYIAEVTTNDILLLALIPSSDTKAANIDNLTEVAPCVIFILRKTTDGDLSPEQLFEDREITQGVMNAVKQKMWDMAGDFDHQDANTRLMRRLILNGMHTDPEYNYLGCNGWSLAFGLDTKGIFNE